MSNGRLDRPLAVQSRAKGPHIALLGLARQADLNMRNRAGGVLGVPRAARDRVCHHVYL